jgi:hypothetical protein
VGQRHVRFGQKQTFSDVRRMSALPPKADMEQHGRDVRFVPKANIDHYSITSLASGGADAGPPSIAGMRSFKSGLRVLDWGTGNSKSPAATKPHFQ